MVLRPRVRKACRHQSVLQAGELGEIQQSYYQLTLDSLARLQYFTGCRKAHDSLKAIPHTPPLSEWGVNQRWCSLYGMPSSRRLCGAIAVGGIWPLSVCHGDIAFICFRDPKSVEPLPGTIVRNGLLRDGPCQRYGSLAF